MLGWLDDITKLTLDNTNFRTVVYTARHTQLTLMSLKPGEEIGWESHPHLNQFLRLEQGKARVEFGRTKAEVAAFSGEGSNQLAGISSVSISMVALRDTSHPPASRATFQMSPQSSRSTSVRAEEAA